MWKAILGYAIKCNFELDRDKQRYKDYLDPSLIFKMDISQDINLGETIVISRKDPMIVLKNQADLEERMDPNFWNAKYQDVLELMTSRMEAHPLMNFLVNEEVISSDHVRASRDERIGPEYDCAYYTVAGILPTGYDESRLAFCSDDAFRRLVRSQVLKNDILIAGTGRGSVGKCCLISTPPQKSVVGYLFIIRAAGMNPYYINIFLKSKFGQSQIERHESGVSGQTHIYKREIESFLISAIPDSIQKTIEQECMRISLFHNEAIRAKKNGDNSLYVDTIGKAEKMQNYLINQLEEFIEGKRSEIESVD